jgi:hypothetical protein
MPTRHHQNLLEMNESSVSLKPTIDGQFNTWLSGSGTAQVSWLRGT